MDNTMALPENEAGKEAERSRRSWLSSIHHFDCYVTASDRVQPDRVYSSPCKTLFELELFWFLARSITSPIKTMQD
eukprot:scaffold10361_cov76-Skeletonema_dohrnii-CCMP3373.AAC.3